MACKNRVFSDCLLVGEALEFPINWTLEFANRWEANEPYAAGARIRPSTLVGQTGFEYESSGGQSNGEEEPAWPTELGETVQDGSITWTARALSNASLRERIDTVNWPAVEDFVIDNEETIDQPGLQQTNARIGSDVRTTQRRLIQVEVTTTAGNEYIGILKLKVE